jgi:hypothetical protein
VNDPLVYLEAIKLRLIASPIIAEYLIMKERATRTDGYLRLKATLVNGDFLELVEVFERGASEIVVVDYRHQWMDASQSQLHRRWDGAPITLNCLTFLTMCMSRPRTTSSLENRCPSWQFLTYWSA